MVEGVYTRTSPRWSVDRPDAPLQVGAVKMWCGREGECAKDNDTVNAL